SMAGHLSGVNDMQLPVPYAKINEFGQLLIATPIVFWGGSIFLERARDSIRNRHPNMFTLIAMGVLSAYGISAVTCLAHLFLDSETFQKYFNFLSANGNGSLKLYFESSAAIITLSLLGQLLELKARKSAGLAIKSLMGLVPKVVRQVKHDG